MPQAEFGSRAKAIEIWSKRLGLLRELIPAASQGGLPCFTGFRRIAYHAKSGLTGRHIPRRSASRDNLGSRVSPRVRALDTGAGRRAHRQCPMSSDKVVAARENDNPRTTENAQERCERPRRRQHVPAGSAGKGPCRSCKRRSTRRAWASASFRILCKGRSRAHQWASFRWLDADRHAADRRRRVRQQRLLSNRQAFVRMRSLPSDQLRTSDPDVNAWRSVLSIGVGKV
jgi:hypothetical protein